jgi:hypothetical protein
MRKLIYIFLFSIAITNAQPFNGAEGAGAVSNVTGGRGGFVYHVTNLNDSGVGSLRYGIENQKTTPRTIVFDVSGTIVMNSWLDILGVENLTIAGQTAPEGGITVQTPAFNLSTGNNIIIRYIRFVNTSYFYSTFTGPDKTGAFAASGTNNLVLDHCSFRYTWGTAGVGIQDNNDTNDGQGNITIQRSIIADCATGMLLGAIVTDPRNDLAGSNSAHHNLFVHVDHRFPNISGNAEAEIVENVVYNYRSRLNTFFNDSETNFINNTFKAGVSSVFNNVRNKIGDYIDTPNGFDTPRVYSSGNRIIESNAAWNHEPTDTDWQGLFLIWLDNSGGQDTEVDAASEARFRATTPFADLGVPITQLGTDAAYTSVLNDVGANKYLNADGTYGTYLDTNDSNYISDVVNGTCWSCNENGGYADKTDPSQLNYPVLPENTRPANFYVSNPNIPEAYLVARGITGNSTIHNQVQPSGYTLLEEYINEVDEAPTGSNPPTITLTGNSTLTFNVGDTYTELGATVTDDVDTGLTATITGVQDGALLSVAGTYYVYYNATDSDSNAATQVVRTLIVNGAGGGSSGSVGKSARIRLLMN